MARRSECSRHAITSHSPRSTVIAGLEGKVQSDTVDIDRAVCSVLVRTMGSRLESLASKLPLAIPAFHHDKLDISGRGGRIEKVQKPEKSCSRAGDTTTLFEGDN